MLGTPAKGGRLMSCAEFHYTSKSSGVTHAIKMHGFYGQESGLCEQDVWVPGCKKLNLNCVKQICIESARKNAPKLVFGRNKIQQLLNELVQLKAWMEKRKNSSAAALAASIIGELIGALKGSKGDVYFVFPTNREIQQSADNFLKEFPFAKDPLSN